MCVCLRADFRWGLDGQVTRLYDKLRRENESLKSLVHQVPDHWLCPLSMEVCVFSQSRPPTPSLPRKKEDSIFGESSLSACFPRPGS